MDKLIMKELKDNYILSSKNVLDLKKYISIKYADLTAAEKANILADAIRKSISGRIPKVEKSLKTSLIDNLVKTSVKQGSFDINSEDVFIECLNLKINLNEDIFLSELCSWVNKLTVNNIEKENMKKFIQSVYSLGVKTYNAESISTVLENYLQEQDSNNTDNEFTSEISNGASSDILSEISNGASSDILSEISNGASSDILSEITNGVSSDTLNEISNGASSDTLSEISNDNSNDNSDKYIESEHLSTEFKISQDHQLNIKEPEKSQFSLVLNKMNEKNHGILQFRRDNKILVFKSIAFVMSLLVAFSLKTNTVESIIEVDNKNQQQIIKNTIDSNKFLSAKETNIESTGKESLRMKADKNPLIEETKIEGTGKESLTMKATAKKPLTEATKIESTSKKSPRMKATAKDFSAEGAKTDRTGIKGLRMKATAYDLSVESCGKSRNHPSYGITSSGTRAAIGRTVAVDPSVIPLGSRLYIKFPKSYSSLDGIYVAEDTGSKIKGNKIDIFLGEDKVGESIVHEKADNFGVQMVEVTVLKGLEKK